MVRGLGILVALVVVLAAAASARAEVVWLCLPGAEPNPCHESLETTIQEQDGTSRVEDPPLAADPAVDCFYVYPTVSEQRSRNADKSKDREVVAITRYQAARYAQLCRVFAPVYRQQTLGGLALGGSADSLKLAYGDVEEAWREYLERHNGGRPFVLIGHSQGTRMLRQLVRREIDPRPELRARLVSALLLGGNVLVRAGQPAGGDFANVPACTAPGQRGCVVAWSTFNETPPSNSRYGRPPAEDTSGFGLPAGPEYEVLCTNPASLDANERREIVTYVRGEPFPGVLGGLIAVMYGGTQPSAPTPWLRPADRYTAACEERDGANVLMLEPVGASRKLNPSPDPSWGLHLADANIAMGDLMRIVEQQIAGLPAAASPKAKPGAKAKRRRPALRIRCGRRLRVVGRDRARVKRVRFVRSGRRVRAIVRLRDGRRIVLRRRCARG